MESARVALRHGSGEQIMSTEPTFVTPDIRHASFLIAKGFKFLGAEDGTGRLRCSFGCSPEEAGTYFGQNDSVSARLLFQAWRDLRDLIDDHRGGGSAGNRSRADAHRQAR